MYKPVVVALRRDPRYALEEQLEQVMAPFVPAPENPERVSHCDGWWIGGHWTGHFLSRHRDHPDLVNPLGFPDASPLAGYTACDGGPKRLLDLDRLLRAAEEEAWRRWPTRFARLFGLCGPWKFVPADPSREDVDALLKGDPELLAQARGQALVREGLVTLEGEWIDPDRAQHEREAAFARADAYVDSLDEDAWLVCLSVHF
ncbi:hypothetical protein A6A08_07440 [Nocardiopsis sp. TSRI0078]|uniref:hypothetical protein n=1 Tax=Nocardiopsis sp. NPDC060348 TaxID=3347102 RepID=UPI00093A5100|nr:hypothetical protein A6A08_07440 [Nocardiopsis sp. TSRI0078]